MLFAQGHGIIPFFDAPTSVLLVHAAKHFRKPRNTIGSERAARVVYASQRHLPFTHRKMPQPAITTNLKRPGDDASDVDRDDGTGSSTTPVHKLQRVDSSSGLGNGDFSNAVKKKSAGSSRTGQACDRCKVNTPISYCIPFTSRVCLPHHRVRIMLTCTLPPDPQDTMRRSPGRLLAVPPEQHRVQDDRSHHWQSYNAGSHRVPRERECPAEDLHGRAAAATKR